MKTVRLVDYKKKYETVAAAELNKHTANVNVL